MLRGVELFAFSVNVANLFLVEDRKFEGFFPPQPAPPDDYRDAGWRVLRFRKNVFKISTKYFINHL